MIGINHMRDFSEARKLIEAGRVYYPNLDNTKNMSHFTVCILSCINKIKNLWLQSIKFDKC